MSNQTTTITGSGTIGEGTYADISISGSGKLTGDIKCEKLNVTGTCKSTGKIDAADVIINGSLKVEDAIRANSITANGSLKVEGDIKTNNFYVNGAVKTEETNVYAEYLEVNGGLTNEKELNADKIVVNGKIKANEIVGTVIEISKHEFGLDVGEFFRFISKSGSINKAESITCETINAKNLKCNKICAENIILKGNCTVDFVECNGRLVIGRTCTVNNIEGDCEIIKG